MCEKSAIFSTIYHVLQLIISEFSDKRNSVDGGRGPTGPPWILITPKEMGRKSKDIGNDFSHYPDK